jgi:hypothetical protein
VQQEKKDYEIFNIKLMEENKELTMKNQNLELNNHYLTVDNKKIHKIQEEIVLNGALKQQIKTLEATIQDRDHTVKALAQKNETILQANQRKREEFEERIKYLEEVNVKNSVFNNLENISFQYPKVSVEVQTETNEYGFWDTTNGWILPVSKTALARLRWRKSFAFAKCPSCRGNPNYILQVNSLLKKCYYGISNNSISEMLLGEERIEMLSSDRFIKWRIPDELVVFLNNLPITVQALKPKSFQWLLHRIYFVLSLKFIAEEEDKQLGYLTQSLTEFLIENFLRNSENRLLAEMDFYHFYLALKEYYLFHPLVTLFARFLYLLDGLTPKEKEFHESELLKNESALKRKKQQEFNQLKPRERAKLVTNLKEAKQKEIEDLQQQKGIVVKSSAAVADKVTKIETASKGFEYLLTDYSLSKDILKIILFIRYCCLQSYSGVYEKPLEEIYSFVHQFSLEKESSMAGFFPPNCKKLLSFESNFQSVKEQFWVNAIQPREIKKNCSPGKEKEKSDPYSLPIHLFFDAMNNKFQSYLPLDRVIHILQPFLHNLKPEEIISIYRSIEKYTRCIHTDGSFSRPEGLNTFVRRTMRLFIYSFPENGEDISSWEEIKRRYQHPSDDKFFQLLQEFTVESFGDNNNSNAQQSVNESNLEGNKLNNNEDRIFIDEDVNKYILMTNFDYFLTIIAEIILKQLTKIEERLRVIFEEGDVNHDNVLSFDEFKAIILRVKPDFPDRTILKMFREALIQGQILIH